MSEEVIVEISTSGDVKVKVKGVKGASCKALTKNLEAALGDVAETRQTGEFNEQTRASHQHKS